MKSGAVCLRPRDWVPALIVAAIQFGGGPVANAHSPGVSSLDTFGYLLLAVGPVALLMRHRFPLPVLACALAAAATYVLCGYGYGPIFMSLVVAFLTAAPIRPRWRTYLLVPLGYLVIIWPLPSLLGDVGPNLWQATGLGAWLAVLVSIAEGIRQRRAVVESRRRAAEAARHDAEAQRLRRASEERLAIARELHDVLGHSLSMINVQSSVALELFDRKPEQAAIALAAIRDASREALGEVHTLLRSIRGADAAPTAPVPSIADVDAVVQHARAAGLEVRTAVAGTARKLPTVVDVAAARIAREALTNVARHAPGANAIVTVGYTPDGIDIRIDNDRPTTVAPPTSTTGTGILGMIERADALGGKLTAGPRPDGGFRVQARLPAIAEANQ
jgi:signal transduction histidine kinase